MFKQLQNCRVHVDGPIWEITIDRPEPRNALHPPACEELAMVFDQFRDKDEAWIAIITGAGEQAFCAGYDLKYQASGQSMTMPPSGFAGLTSRFALAKPVIAALNGCALGGGLETVLCCDIVVSDEQALLGLPEPKVGMLALGGGIHRLVRQIGEKLAMEMLLTGQLISAQRGYEIGLVNHVVASGDAMTKAREIAASMLECSPVSLRVTKEMAMQGLTKTSLEEAIHGSYDGIHTWLSSEDLQEGPRAFAEKRKPIWKNR